MTVVELKLHDHDFEPAVQAQLPPILKGTISDAEWKKIGAGVKTHFRRFGPREIPLREWLGRFVCGLLFLVITVCSVVIGVNGTEDLPEYISWHRLFSPASTIGQVTVAFVALTASTFVCNLFYGDMVVRFSHETRAKRLREFFQSMKDIDTELKVHQNGLSYDFVHVLKFHTK